MTDAEILAALNEDADKPAVDICLGEDGDLLFVEGRLVFTRGKVASAQSIAVQVERQLGESFLNPDKGIPYFTEVYVKDPNLAALRERFRKTIASAYGVATVRSVDIVLDSSTRTASIPWQAQIDTGEVIEGTEEV